MTFKILNLEPEDYSDDARNIIRSVAHLDEKFLSRDALKNIIGAYDGLIVRLRHKIDHDILQYADTLKVIVTATTGLNHIDMAEAKKRGVTVLSLRGETDFLKTITATAEHTIGLLLNLMRHIPAAHNSVIENIWDRDQFKGRELSGKTIGIIGFGRLGQLVAQYATAFGMSILAHDIQNFNDTENIRFVPMDTLLEQSDIISLHVLYTPETHHLINAECFAKIKRGALFINTARGEIIDEQALLHALENGILSGAALDVLSGENNNASNWMHHDPLIHYARAHNNLLITPHIGGATFDSMAKTEIFMAQKLKKFIETY